MTQASGDLARGRLAAGRQAWADALDALSRADLVAALGAADLQLLATAAYLRDDLRACASALQRAAESHRSEGDVSAAVRCQFWLGFILLHRGESAQAAGWFARAARLLGDAPPDSAEHGLLLLPDLVAALWMGDYEAADDLAVRIIAIGVRTHDQDLLSNALHFGGRARLRDGRISEGLRWLDESMIGVVNDEVLPFVAGNLYCAMIDACAEISDLGRVGEWTEALTDWTGRQPELIIFSGDCLVHRAEILQLHGSWAEATEQAELAAERLRRTTNRDAVGSANYRQGELHRIRGDLPLAEQAYRSAGECGFDPQPGMALLRLAQGDHVGAVEAIERVLAEVSGPWQRAKILPARVTILLDGGDVEGARSSADELVSLAARVDSTCVHAVADLALGSVLVADQNPQAALPVLRRAAAAWRTLKAPYDVALARVQIGLACRAMAEQLVLSERTVDRHVSNIFAKLQVSSRSAATAYLYQHRL